MTTEPVHSGAVDAGLFLPAEGLSLLGEDQGSGYPGRRFLVLRGDGEVIRLPLLLYLIMAAIAEGGVDGGWSADQVGARVGASSGQRLTAENVRYLIAGKLTPLGLTAAGAADLAVGSPGAAPAPAVSPPPGPTLSARPPRPRPGAGRGGWPPWYRRRPWALAVAAAAVLASTAAVAPIMASSGSRGPGGPPSVAAVVATSSASAAQAAVWVARQVSRDVTVWCEPGMCRRLQLAGFPAARLKPLPPSARGPLRSGVVVATAAIRSQLGPRLAACAPQLIASFGAGAARVDVRAVAPDGAAAFAARLAAEQAVLASVGRQLLRNSNIQASAAARAALRAGQVDARLLAILSLLAAQLPVRLVEFTGAPGAGPGVPLRGAEIGAASAAARSTVIALLNAQQSPYRPAVAAGAGQPNSAITLWFDAPAALDIAQP